jgi:hypothetical protein
MRVSGFIVLAILGTVYLLLSLNSDGLLAGFGYVFAALMFSLAIVNVLRPPK